MIVTLTGENNFAVTMAERQLVKAFVAKHSEHGVERIDAESLTSSGLPDLLQGANLFAPARLVILRNLKANPSLLEPLTEALKHAASDTTVVIADTTLDKRTKLYAFLKKHSTFKDFPVLSEGQLVKWLQDEAVKLGSSLPAAEARILIHRGGNDQWRLAGELQKLALQPVITPAAIEQMVEPTPEATAFQLLDAALAGRVTETAAMLNVLKTQEDPYKLFGLLASQVYNLAVVSAAGSRSPEAIAKEAGLHPFAVRKAKTITSRLGQAKVRQMVADVAQCDAQLKSTGADPWQLLRLCLQK